MNFILSIFTFSVYKTILRISDFSVNCRSIDLASIHTFNCYNQASSAPGLVSQISFSSVDYTVEGEDADVVQSPDQISVISAPVGKPDEPTKAAEAAQGEAAAVAQGPPKVDLPTLGYCFALYDYEAEACDELNLEEGQVCLHNYHCFLG